MLKTLLVLLLGTATTFAVPHLEPRANGIITCPGDPACPQNGPGGHLKQPVGGANFGQNGQQQGYIDVIYSTVSVLNKPSLTRTFTTNAIFSLRNATINHYLANLAPRNEEDDIEGLLTIPAGFCGRSYQLVVIEQQLYRPGPVENQLLQFQSAAPTINIKCCGIHDGEPPCAFPS